MSSRRVPVSGNHQELGRLIREGRVKMRLSQDKLGEAVGMSRAWVSLMENGLVEDVPIANLRMLAGALHIPLAPMVELIGAADPPLLRRRVTLTEEEIEAIVARGVAQTLRALGIPEDPDGVDLLAERLLAKQRRTGRA